MKKIFFCIVMLMFTATVAGASEIDGRPGQYEMQEAIIDITGDSIYSLPGLCLARYADTFMGNSVISNPGSLDETRIKVVVNKKKVIATCKFPDTSGVYEGNAEVGYFDQVCTLVTEDATYEGGSGHVTRAANLTDEDGGNVTIKCTFNLDE